MRRTAAIFAFIWLLTAAPAVGAPATVTIDDRAPELAKVDRGGWKLELGLTNLTDTPGTVGVTPRTGDGSGCMPVATPGTLGPAQHTAVEVTLPATCDVHETKGIDLTVTTDVGATTTFDITSAAQDGLGADWEHLLVFPIVFALMLAFVSWLYRQWSPSDQTKHRLDQTLAELEADWSFKESWVSNVTVLAGLLTGLFGSAEVVEALLGEDAEDTVALATVGVAIALALAAAAPLVVLGSKARVGAPTIRAILAASAVTLTAGFAQVYIGWRVGAGLDLGGVEDYLVFALLAVWALLLWYAGHSLLALLDSGTGEVQLRAASDAANAATRVIARHDVLGPDRSFAPAEVEVLRGAIQEELLKDDVLPRMSTATGRKRRAAVL